MTEFKPRMLTCTPKDLEEAWGLIGCITVAFAAVSMRLSEQVARDHKDSLPNLKPFILSEIREVIEQEWPEGRVEEIVEKAMDLIGTAFPDADRFKGF